MVLKEDLFHSFLIFLHLYPEFPLPKRKSRRNSWDPTNYNHICHHFVIGPTKNKLFSRHLITLKSLLHCLHCHHSEHDYRVVFFPAASKLHNVKDLWSTCIRILTDLQILKLSSSWHLAEETREHFWASLLKRERKWKLRTCAEENVWRKYMQKEIGFKFGSSFHPTSSCYQLWLFYNRSLKHLWSLTPLFVIH